MNGRHTTKSISFLMELIFVLLFFTLSSAVSVFVIVNARDAQKHATALRNVMFYTENLIEDKENHETYRFLYKSQFYMDENGHPSEDKAYYRVRMKHETVDGLENRVKCTMSIYLDNEELTEVSFLMDKEEQS